VRSSSDNRVNETLTGVYVQAAPQPLMTNAHGCDDNQLACHNAGAVGYLTERNRDCEVDLIAGLVRSLRLSAVIIMVRARVGSAAMVRSR
jgi:hypothetical protein